uniref:PUA domain-containing protein n=1 Tax=Entomoneis paludosa TaxID=265537 RepID=A0A7S2VAQ9_9STRA
MFRKFDRKEVSTSTQVKASVQRALKSQLLEMHPHITEEEVDALLPKKNPLVQYKLGAYTLVYCRRTEHEDKSPTDEPILYQDRDGPIMPTLKCVHQYPTLQFAKVTVDKGAIPFLLGGANVMSPGLTNKGGEMPPDTDERPGVAEGDGVVIYAEGKEYAIGIGIMTMSSADIRSKNKGNAIQLMHYLGDGLYQIDEI